MGQIVFLYFLQKKGWLGVGAWPNALNEKEYKNAFYARGSKSRELIPKIYVPVGDGTYRVSARALDAMSDEDEAILAQCVKGKPWGSGPHNFMRKLFEVAEKKEANFFDDYLEPLFYNALNVNRGEQGYDPALHCRIPFLSGGLFEPIDGYDWEHNDFDIPNEIFSNRINNNPRTGDGILDIFDRYNFTMSEDEPMEREVAIDPEMLGKVFENLLEVNDRKAKGAFYTPREIVHYMCQESLINYLKNAINVSEEAVRDFILYGDLMKDEDTVKEKRLGNNGMYISEELYKLDNDGKIIANKLLDMDKALADVRVADPAVGSGAFPLGMLNEIVRARQNISAYMAITMNAYDTRMMYSMERSAHNLKFETIKNCIYAADLDPSAVDIAQLRLWLSLVIDDEINPEAQSMLDGHRNPLPLPNLECNILCGNSLIDSFEGIKLINASELIGTVEKFQQQNLGMQRFDQILCQLIDTQGKLFVCEDTEKKKMLLDEISELRNMIVMHQLYGCSKDIIEKYQETRSSASKPYVLWQLDFAKVFKEKGGFDIVIGNPPYIQLQKTISEKLDIKLGDMYVQQGFETFAKTGDIYCLFYEKGWQLLHNRGVLSFITSNKWMRAGYGEKLRSFLTSKTNPIQLIDFAGQKIFESATVDVNILIFSKEKNMGNTKACVAKDECRDNLSVFVQQKSSSMSFNANDSWTVLTPIEQSIKTKIETIGIPLKEWDVCINYGIKTGFNDAFIISGEKKDELIASDPKSAEIIRPILRGKDIKRYKCNFANLWIIATFPSKKYNIDEYPAVKNYLLSFSMERLEQTGKKHLVNGIEIKSRKKTSNKWFETQDSISYWNDFSQQKIMYNDICQRLSFSLVPENVFCVNTVYFIKNNKHLLYLLGCLNSNLIDWYYRTLSVQLGNKAVRMFSIYVENIPIPKLSEVQENIIVELINKLLMTKDLELRNEIDSKLENIILDLYQLNDNEKKYIKSKYNRTIH